MTAPLERIDDNLEGESIAAIDTLRRALARTPVLRRGIAWSLGFALFAVSGRLALPILVQAVIDHVRPGASCRELDAISRRVLKEHGFPDYPHSLGHPLSGFVTPQLSKTSEVILKPGHLFTVEPGIYLPGYGGVRMEENVVVTEDGYEQLTRGQRLL